MPTIICGISRHNDYPWLRESGEARACTATIDAMCKNYLIDDFLADSAPHAGAVKSVHVQANWNPTIPSARPAGARASPMPHGFPHAIVAHANLADADVEDLLAAHRESPNVRGIRHILGHTDDPELARPDRPDYAAGPGLGTRLRIARQITTCASTCRPSPAQMAAVAEVAARHQDVPLIVCHTGFSWDRSEAGIASVAKVACAGWPAYPIRARSSRDPGWSCPTGPWSVSRPSFTKPSTCSGRPAACSPATCRRMRCERPTSRFSRASTASLPPIRRTSKSRCSMIPRRGSIKILVPARGEKS